MKRAYITGGLFLLAGLIVSVAGIIVTRVSIPDAEVSALNLDGRLVLAHENNGVSILDLSSGESQHIFTPTERGLVTSAALSPDGTMLALAYAPPEGLIQFGFTNLYVLPVDGADEPTILVDGHTQAVIYSPVWSPDGENIVYVRSQAAGLGVQLSIERIAYPAREPEIVVESGFAPDLSTDGGRLAYITAPRSSSFDSLLLANNDGTQPADLVGGDAFVSIERLSLSPDGTTIAFSAEENPLAATHSGSPVGQTLHTVFGVSRASAHDEASISDIWAISTAGGTPHRVAKTSAVGIVLDYSPDGEHIAFVTSEGLYIMGSDGSGLARISEQSLLRSVQWVP